MIIRIIRPQRAQRYARWPWWRVQVRDDDGLLIHDVQLGSLASQSLLNGGAAGVYDLEVPKAPPKLGT